MVTADGVSDHSSESGLASPKPGHLKSFKGWGLAVDQPESCSGQSTNQSSSLSESDEWCPWGHTNPNSWCPNSLTAPSCDEHTDTDSFGHSLQKWTSDDVSDDVSGEVANDVTRAKKVSDFTFDPIPSLDIGQGIWSNANSAASGW